MNSNSSSDAITLNEESIGLFRNTLTTLERLAQSPDSELDIQHDDQRNIVAAYATLITGESVEVLPLIHHFSSFSTEDVVSFIDNEDSVSRIYAYCNHINEYLEASRASARLRAIRQDLMAYADSPSDGDGNVQDSSSQILDILDNLKQVTYLAGEEAGCPICLEKALPTDTFVQLTCHETHQFHLNCVQDWLQAGSRTCPICRKLMEVADP